MARSLVDGLFDELRFTDKVLAAIERAEGWNQPMQDAAISFARLRESDPANGNPNRPSARAR